MSNLKTSISIVALVAGLTFGFAPQSAFADDAPAQNGGAIAGIGHIKDNVEHRDEFLAKRDAEEAARQRNIEKALVKPQTTAHIDTGGQSGFPVTPKVDVKPEEPGLIEKCVGGVCSYIKWASGWTIGKAIYDNVIAEPDEAQAQKEHNAAADKAAQERNKAEESKKTAEAPKSTQLKMADVKNLENTNGRTLNTPTHTSAKPLSLETPKAAAPAVTRAPVTVASHIEVRQAVNVVHPTINVAQPRIPQVTIRIPTVAIRR